MWCVGGGGGGGGADGVNDERVSPCTPTDAPDYGDRVPVDTTPGPAPDVQDPKKSPLPDPAVGVGQLDKPPVVVQRQDNTVQELQL